MSWLVDPKEWFSVYRVIKNKLPGLSFNKDQDAADLLSNILQRRMNVVKFHELILRFKDYGEVFVIGCSEEALDEVERNIKGIKKGLIIAADGAASLLTEFNIVPQVVVTDLDGDLEDLTYLSKKGSVLVIHAHGDNIYRIEDAVPKFEGPLIGSTQVEPRPYVYNFGGFTDGDRAVYVAYHLGFRVVNLVGFNFEKPNPCPGDYRQLDVSISKVKLDIAKFMLKIIAEKGMGFKCFDPRPCQQILQP